MSHIFTWKNKKLRERTPEDIYFDSLEEAYANLPVPSDDYADIKFLLRNHFALTESFQDADTRTNIRVKELEDAINTIREHYELIGSILKKQKKYA